jgi:serine/threonine protein phosphatase 1
MTESGRLIAVADIHGCLEEFNALLKQIDPDPRKDTLIILGDVIDRGYDSIGVIRTLIELKDTFSGRMIWLCGNHEDDLIRNSQNKRIFHRKEENPLSRYARMFSELPLFYETEMCIFVHAGFNGDCTDRDCILSDRTVLNGERIYRDRLYIAGHSPFYKDSPVPFDEPVYMDETGRRHIVHEGMRLPEKGAIFIDTGCVYKNRLTALIIDEDLTVHISSVKFIGI